MYEQRAPEPEPVTTEPTERHPWRPVDTPLDKTEEFGPEDRYVAVDRIDGRVATLAVASWPTVEPETGRLDFGPLDTRHTETVALSSLQTRVDVARGNTGQLVRPVRPGDVFLVRGFAPTPGRWTAVIDVTRSGRLAAKAALFSTAAPAPRSDELRDYGLDRRLADPEPPGLGEDRPAEPEQAPPGPIAYPAV